MEEESFVEESWERNHGGGIMGEEPWRRNPGRGIMGEESWRRNHGRGIMGKESWGAIWRHLEPSRPIWSHLEPIWEATGDTWEAPGGSPGTPGLHGCLGWKMRQNHCVLPCLSSRPPILRRRERPDPHQVLRIAAKVDGRPGPTRRDTHH